VETVCAIQDSVRKGNKRFLFEMATGTGKTLVSAVVIKLFLRTGNLFPAIGATKIQDRLNAKSKS